MSELSRSISLPSVNDSRPTKIARTTSVNPYTSRGPQGITTEERDRKMSELENFINEGMNIQKDEGDYVAEILTQDDERQNNKFFYFIGRLNPPHNGHIKALEQLVRMANEQGSMPLILLGSGPRGERTMDNPITFETKEQFIRSVLPGEYIIKKMDNPAKNVSDYIREGLEDSGNRLQNIDEITIKHIAGGKDEDATKLSFALKSAEKTARELVPGANIEAGVETIDAAPTDSGEAMSATKVRKDAYITVLDGSGFEGWPEQYKQFYGPNAQQIYNEILFPLEDMSEDKKINAITRYIKEGVLPASEPSQQSRKRKRGGTKRKSKKNKKKTQKRKRRVSRRKY
jgi:nicotinamide mononucleotide adenylyltransferase